jgi:serine/threonine protein kinase/Flp pilus assembly protein TadD
MSVASGSASERELRFQAVAAEYLEAREAGRSDELSALLARHPDLADELTAFVADQDQVAHLAAPLRNAVATAALPEHSRLPDSLGDFRIVREIGRGGMGIVYEAEQLSLGRRVALKVLPFAATMDPRQLQRFHNEARAAAGLHHTNIVPVYGVGCERGVHYYAMQFIDGRTLAEFIAEQRGGPPSQVPTMAEAEAAASATTVPPAAQVTSAAPRDAAYFRRVAEWGIQAAEALDCAHSLGVVHRDVKPANLLVDGTGRLWVTDFGLAQVQSDARLTMTGDLVGTLRYMSPEQALAKRVVIDHRTDVYSLGATLYELLTLEPAFDGADRQELLRQIAFEEPRPPRRINKAIPAEQETIVLKAMEKNPADRYTTVKDLADDLQHWLEDRPIRARRPSLGQRARKWARRHKPLVGATAAVLVVVALLGGAVGLSWVRTRAAAEGEARVLLRNARRLGQEEKWDEALSAAQHSKALLSVVGADPGLRQESEGLVKDLRMIGRLEEVRLEGAALRVPDRFAAADAGYAIAFADHGLDVAATDAKTVADHVRASAIRIQLLEALDDWAYVKDRLRYGDGESVRAVARLADDDPWRQQLRDPQVRQDRAALERLAQDEAALTQPRVPLTWLGELLRAAGALEAEVRLLRAAQRRRPGEYYTNNQLAHTLATNPATLGEAISFFRATLALRPQNPRDHYDLGKALYENGQPDEAIAEYREAIRLKSDYPEAHCNLGGLLAERGQLDEAMEELRKAIATQQSFPEAYIAHEHLGNALREKGQLTEAQTYLRRAHELKAESPQYAGQLAMLALKLLEQKKNHAGAWRVIPGTRPKSTSPLRSQERGQCRLVPDFRVERAQPFRPGGAEEALIGGNENQVVAGAA